MNDKINKNIFSAAVAEGMQRANEINAKVSKIIDIIGDASNAVNNVYDDVKITTSLQSDASYIRLSAYVNFKDGLESRKCMDVEIYKENGDAIVVTTKKGKTTVSTEDDIIRILLDLLSSPTLWSGIAEMRSRNR